MAQEKDYRPTLSGTSLQALDVRDLQNIGRDVVDRIVSGVITGNNSSRNFLRCAFRDTTVSNCDWRRGDFKDCSFIRSSFDQFSSGENSVGSSTYRDCVFVDCRFDDASFYGNNFVECRFIRCNFKNSMIRDSKIISCLFDSCETSNKLFDGCFMHGNEFVSTRLDFSVINDNIGLDAEQLSLNLIREDRSFPDERFVDFETLLNNLDWISGLSPINRMKFLFFIGGGELTASTAGDEIFQLDRWVDAVRAPINFKKLLSDLGEFIVFCYHNNRGHFIFILKLAILSRAIWVQFSNDSERADIARTASGIYLTCLPILNEIDLAIVNLIPNGVSEIIFFGREETGELQAKQAVSALRPYVNTAKFEIVPRNSPFDIVISALDQSSLVFTIVMFLCIRMKFEINKILPHSNKEDVIGQVGPALTQISDRKTPVISVSIGGAKDELKGVFSVAAALPGSLHFSATLDYNLALAKDLKDFIAKIKILDKILG